MAMRFTSRGFSLAFALFGSFLLLLQRVKPWSVKMLVDDYASEQAPMPRLYIFDQDPESISNPSLKQQPEEQGELPMLRFQEYKNENIYDEEEENYDESAV